MMIGRHHHAQVPDGFKGDEYPKMRHHLTEKPVIVKTPAEQEEHAPDEDGWVDDLEELEQRKKQAKAEVVKPTSRFVQTSRPPQGKPSTE